MYTLYGKYIDKAVLQERYSVNWIIHILKGLST